MATAQRHSVAIGSTTIFFYDTVELVHICTRYERPLLAEFGISPPYQLRFIWRAQAEVQEELLSNLVYDGQAAFLSD
ncbi:hypothetical protein VRRI112168_16570 [Vreelandella rituensis]